MKFKKISEISIINGKSLKKNNKWDYINYLDTSNITYGQINEIKNMNINQAPSRAKRIVNKDDIIYSTVRPNLCHYGIIRNPVDNMIVSTGFAVITAKREKVIPEYLYAYLTLPTIIDTLQAIAETTTSTYPSIKPSDIGNIEIPIPNIDTQRKISDILFSIDSKIELNNKLNDNLEALLLNEFNSRFAMYNSTNLPKGYYLGNVAEFFDIGIGKTPPRKENQWFTNRSDDTTWVSISDMGSCGMYISDSSEYLTKDAIEKFNIKVVPDNTVLLSFKLTVGRVAITDGNLTTNEAIAHFNTSNKNIVEYLYCYLKLYNYDILGSTSSIAKAINSKIIKSMSIIIPDDENLRNFNGFAKPITIMIKTNLRQNRNLISLRDVLLPKLMSGEIDLDNFELNI